MNERPRPFGVLLMLAIASSMAVGQYLETTIPVGDSPAEIVWADAVNKVYVANTQDASVTVIDGSTNDVVATIPVGDYPGFLCWNPRENKVYCTRGDGDRLVVIDAIGDTVTREVSVPYYPGHMVYNQTMNKLYVSCSDDPVYRISVLDCGPDTVLRNIPVKGVGRLLWHPVTNRIFCYSDLDMDTAKVIDCETDEVAGMVPVDNGGYFLGCWCHSPVNGLVYLAGRRSVYVLTPTGDSLVTAVPVLGRDLEFGPYPNKIFAVSGATFAIDGSTNTVIDSLSVPGSQLACDTQLDKLYSVHLNSRSLYIIDAQADSLLMTIPLGRSPERLSWNSINNRIYISDFLDNTVSVIRDTSTGVTEHAGSRLPPKPAATVVRHNYYHSGQTPDALLDACGRKVLRVQPGSNDLSQLVPGVYTLLGGESGQRRRLMKLK